VEERAVRVAKERESEGPCKCSEARAEPGVCWMNKMEGLTSKKTKEPPKKVNHKRKIKFPNLPPLVVRSISNKKMEGPPEKV
jgi:hypothetical protein